MKVQDDTDNSQTRNNVLSRRNILLAGSTLAAVSALGSSSPISRAQAQPAPSGRRPNILVIFGDDIGQTNISAYSFGLMATRRRTSTASPAKASRLPSCVSRNYSTCDQTPTSVPTSRRTPFMIFSCRTEQVRSSHLKPSWRHFWPPSRSFPRVSGRRASASTN
jgi:hypothetical protein